MTMNWQVVDAIASELAYGREGTLTIIPILATMMTSVSSIQAGVTKTTLVTATHEY